MAKNDLQGALDLLILKTLSHLGSMRCSAGCFFSPRATEIITRRLSEHEPGFVSLVTILEVVWVLKSLYKRSRQEIANDIEMILAADTLEVQNEQQVYHAVVALRNRTGSFEDALIGSLGIWRGVFRDPDLRRKGCAETARFRFGLIVPLLQKLGDISAFHYLFQVLWVTLSR